MIESYQEQLRAAIDPAEFSGLFPGGVVDQFRRVLRDWIDSIDITSLTPEQKQMVIAAAKWAFDTFVRPMAIPDMVDNWMWLAAESYLRRKLAL